ncbi:MAG: alpha-glucosidase/alpha-galactosidase [Oscillospiraceae bacterium]|jgi:alpha-galactosidase|nr:alpha-glucosidase/alpha-galactosidase [Oscillospiraceae bacterium]
MEKNLKNITIAYIGGGSRGWAWRFMADLALDGDICGTVRLYDIDQKAADANAVIGGRISANPGAKSRWVYESVPSLQSALSGADFVVISILPGTFEEMRSDVHEPEKYGVYQSVGDTVGPGGFVRALRTIPMITEIANAVKEYCPKAWIINYTNPMSLSVAAIYSAFPKARAFGCCHEVFHTQTLLMAMLKKEHGITVENRQDVHINVYGVNHFTWVDSASFKGLDLMPLYADFADKYWADGFLEDPDKTKDPVFVSANRVKFDLFRRFGVAGAAGDRHLAEFMPPWYLKNPETAAKWKFMLTPVSWRFADLERRLARSQRLASGAEEFPLVPSGEEGILLMKALLGVREFVSNVNIPNAGQIPNLPLGAVVETNALFRLDQIKPLIAGSLPGNIRPLIARHADNQENTLKAALSFDFRLALTTFLNDPLMCGVSETDGETLLKTMMANTAKYLPKEWGV